CPEIQDLDPQGVEARRQVRNAETITFKVIVPGRAAFVRALAIESQRVALARGITDLPGARQVYHVSTAVWLIARGEVAELNIELRHFRRTETVLPGQGLVNAEGIDSSAESHLLDRQARAAAQGHHAAVHLIQNRVHIVGPGTIETLFTQSCGQGQEAE